MASKYKIKIQFLYKNQEPDKQREKICSQLCDLVSKLYALPTNIEIQFESMGQNVYGLTSLDPRSTNRIRINQDLTLDELVPSLIHELLHLHQIFTDKLRCKQNGHIVWLNEVYKVDMLKVSYEEYKKLPWEEDVDINFKKISNFVKNINSIYESPETKT